MFWPFTIHDWHFVKSETRVEKTNSSGVITRKWFKYVCMNTEQVKWTKGRTRFHSAEHTDYAFYNKRGTHDD